MTMEPPARLSLTIADDDAPLTAAIAARPVTTAPIASLCRALDGTGHHRRHPPGPGPQAGRVWLLRWPVPGGVLADRWFSVVHARTASWVAFR
jgi:hypothetical protein